MSSEYCYKVHAFTSESDHQAAGNGCELFVHLQPHFDAGINLDAITTRCHTWPQQFEGHFDVQCFAAGKAIFCCGHGLLTAAAYWLKHRNMDTVILHMSDSRVKAYKEQQRIWLSFSRITTVPFAIPLWLPLFAQHHKAICAALAGGDRGYCIVRWPDDVDLKQFQPPGIELGKHTQRALIYTCKDTTTGDSDFHYRYFAPQYGVDEDVATGSAMRVLLDFWAQEYSESERVLTALQTSLPQGLLFGRIHPNTIEVGGYVNEASSNRELYA